MVKNKYVADCRSNIFNKETFKGRFTTFITLYVKKKIKLITI